MGFMLTLLTKLGVSVVQKVLSSRLINTISSIDPTRSGGVKLLVNGLIGTSLGEIKIIKNDSVASVFGVFAGILAGAAIALAWSSAPFWAPLLAGVLVSTAAELAAPYILPSEWNQFRWPPTHPGRWDPLVVDLNGDGVKLTPLAGTKVNFDFGADGFAEQTGWVSAQDGLVVLDRNKNGKIDNGTELFGNATEDGFAALAKLDLNKDGMIDSKDSVFKDLRIWRDANGNGVTDAGELLRSAEIGVLNIDRAKGKVSQIRLRRTSRRLPMPWQRLSPPAPRALTFSAWPCRRQWARA